MTSKTTSFEAIDFGLAANGRPILNNLSFRLDSPGLVGIVGRSGSGKSSLLRAVTGLLSPGSRWDTRGDLLVNEVSFRSWNPTQLRRTMMYVPQNSVALPKTIADNLVKPQLINNPGTSRNTAECLARKAMEMALLDSEYGSFERSAAQMSGGQIQRLSIARALSLDPPVLLFDEPTSSLDPVATSLIKKCLHDISRQRIVVVVSHDMDLARVCDWVMFLDTGSMLGSSIVADGTPQEVFDGNRDSVPHNFARGRLSEYELN